MNHIFFTNSSVEGHLDFQFLGRVTQSVSSSLEGLLEFCCLTLGVFFTGSLLMIASISLGIIGLFNLFIWSLFRFGKWYRSRNFLFVIWECHTMHPVTLIPPIPPHYHSSQAHTSILVSPSTKEKATPSPLCVAHALPGVWLNSQRPSP